MSTDLVSRKTITELCDTRDFSIDAARRAIFALREAFELARSATPGCPFHADHNCLGYGAEYSKDAQTLEKWVKALDRDCWKSLVKSSGIRGMLNRASLEAFTKTLDKEPPPFISGNVIATVASLAAQAPQMMEATILDAFRALSRRYKSNDGTKFGRRAVLRGVLTSYGFVSEYAQADVRDIERSMYLLDGKPPPEAGDLTDWLRSGRKECSRAVLDCEYFKARAFINGNVHLEFKRRDLIDRANAVLAKLGGAALTDQQ